MELSAFEEVAPLAFSTAVGANFTLRALTLAVATKVPDPMKDPTHITPPFSIHCAMGCIIPDSYSAEKPKGMR